jgi:hypothetical protein
MPGSLLHAGQLAGNLAAELRVLRLMIVSGCACYDC